MASVDPVDLGTLTDLCTPWCVHVVATLGIADRLAAGVGDVEELAAVEHLGPLAGPRTAALAALPRERFPVLAETAGHARCITPDEEFRRGLDAVLRGLGDPVAAHRSIAATPTPDTGGPTP